MKSKNRAFTLVELLIVLSIMIILTGIVSQLWFKIERINKGIHRNTQFFANGDRVLDRMTKDIHDAISVEKPDNTLLVLTQLDENGQTRKVTYYIDGKQIVRDCQGVDGTEKSYVVFTTTIETLHVSLPETGVVDLEWMGTRTDQPLHIKTKKLIARVTWEDPS